MGGVRRVRWVNLVSDDDHELVERFYEFMAGPSNPDGLADLYASDALVIRFDGMSAGSEEILTFLGDVRRRHHPYELQSIDQFTKVGDVVMWDGFLETTEVFVLNDEGKIERHIPGIRGYWGG